MDRRSVFWILPLLFSLFSSPVAEAQNGKAARESFQINLEPVTATDGTVTGIHIIKTVPSESSTAAFEMSAELAAALVKGVADRIRDLR